MTETLPPQPRTDLPSRWEPVSVEARLYQGWVDRGYFSADPNSGKPPFCIVIPPPNVTGSLHLGHAMDHTLIDTLTRRRRMQGYDALWLPGMDHAGIATQNVVERQLAVDGKSRHDFGRELFVEKVWDWKRESGGAILGQMRRLGDGVDWSRERFTLDEGLSKAVQTIFKKLFDDDLIYRAERIINWCPRCRTALSDIEVEHSEDEGELVSIRYGDGDDSVVVATTRVETMLGDTGIAVHPDDPRYAHLVGRDIELPIVGRRIPVVADEHVDQEFGTGAVKVTPAHDPNDFEIGRRHDLAMPVIMDEGAVIANSGTRFDGMDRFVAREAVREELRAQGRIVAEKRPYLHSVGHCSRCDTVVEPRLSLQWFVRVAPLARAAGDAVRDGRVTVHPKELEQRYFDWVDNMHDWTISRQLWWGHRIPVWYGPNGEVRCVGPDEELPGEGWTQDSDVLDTWFSSGLWPFSTLGWPADTADLRRYYPTSVLVTGYDILFFWVARMMMLGLYAMDGVPPFEHVFLHGLVRDQYGKKMSKSRGNTIDPLALIDNYGADALRFTITRGANPGADMALSEEWVAGSRNFGTKLWNATRFALANGADPDGEIDPSRLTDADRWILDRLATVVTEVDALLEDYQFAKATELLYHFTWDEFCDWYLELAKVQLAGEGAENTKAVLGNVLDVLLRVLHPIMPFITEELWTTLTGGESLVIASWPKITAQAGRPDGGAAERVAAVIKLVTEVRRFRADQGLRPGQWVPARVTGGLGAEQLAAARALARLGEPEGGFTATASLEVGLGGGPVRVELDTSGTIDVAAERARLGKDLVAAEKELAGTEAKLGNAKFTERAPADVVAGIRARRDAAVADIERIRAGLAALPEA
ncbi:valine--tRNA ligase [Pseudonocardia eucalypti]|uniref:Valine--tRNA ligase n=1 Tax=Pseudonocardia eucalypti TaxID=648755 RepID=A0ABP9PY69_9PSEU|nr:valyl-tRNA synthetase [Pseudonocardia eucalypti]